MRTHLECPWTSKEKKKRASADAQVCIRRASMLAKHALFRKLGIVQGGLPALGVGDVD